LWLVGHNMLLRLGRLRLDDRQPRSRSRDWDRRCLVVRPGRLRLVLRRDW
jgi:hypothetical protein